jgi:hypothetical protein
MAKNGSENREIRFFRFLRTRLFSRCGHDNLLLGIFFRKEIGACPQNLLYHGFGIRSISTKIPSIKGGGVSFRIEQERYTLRCPCLQVKGTNNRIRTMKRQA